jgi:hypothetical protein
MYLLCFALILVSVAAASTSVNQSPESMFLFMGMIFFGVLSFVPFILLHHWKKK